MSGQLINGKELSEKMRTQLALEIEQFKQKFQAIGLAVVLVGDDEASKVYVKNKLVACEQVGIRSFHYQLPKDVVNTQVLQLIDVLNQDKQVHGILVQLPLPKHIDEQQVLNRIDPKKDVDGFLPYHVGKLLLGQPTISSCTPAGCMELLAAYHVAIAGKHAVVVGRSNIVGKPLAIMLLQADATVTLCHSKTPNLAQFTKQADILIAAVGKPKLITADMVKKNAVVIDVGMNRVNGILCGDVDFEQVKEVASYITPVPKGVGPMTITMLLKNTLKAAKLQIE